MNCIISDDNKVLLIFYITVLTLSEANVLIRYYKLYTCLHTNTYAKQIFTVQFASATPAAVCQKQVNEMFDYKHNAISTYLST
jgi:hypothetical protein